MKKVYLIFALSFGLFFSSNMPVNAETEAVVGIPRIQTRITMRNAHNIQLDNNQKRSNKLVIMKDSENAKYYWQTRDHRELIYKKKKGFDLFTDPETGGYIKVMQQSDGRYVYMEHISFKNMKAFTYWGIINLYEP